MNSSTPDPDPLHGLNPEALMSAAALPTEDGADTPPLAPGDLPSLEEIAAAFPDLEILDLIGHGGMSAVFLARQPKLDRLVALKVLPKSLAATPGFTERFTREGRVLARLSHPNIVAVHDFGESGGFCYLLMEHVDGVNLRQAMQAGRFTPEQALTIVPFLCEALQFAHNHGVLHRDIKPENILLDAKGRVKIADFGIAKIIGEESGEAMLLTQTGSRLGTAPYMAPEQIEQPASVDHRADIYSLGVVFYEMLTGELPLGRFAAPSEKAAVSGGMDEVVFRSLEKERGRRQQSAEELKTQIAGVGSGPGTSQRFTNYPTPFEYKSKRTVFGMPLLHVVSGPDPETGKGREARGFFAFGDRARGIFAFGGIARGWFACGGVAIGGVTMGGACFGLISIGGLAVGLLFAMGGLGVGALSTGGLAAGWHAVGGVALGWHALGGAVFAHEGTGGHVDATRVVSTLQEMPPLTQWLASLLPYNSLIGFLWIPLMAVLILVPAWARRQLKVAAGGASEIPGLSSTKVFWLIPATVLPGGIFWWVTSLWATHRAADPVQFLLPTVTTCIGMLLWFLGLPLWLRLIPRNPLYGVRLPSTLSAEGRWYDVNAHAGKQLFGWSIVVIAAGIAGFYQLPRHQDAYPWAAITLLLFSVGAPLVSTLKWNDRYPEKPSRLVRWSGQCVMGIILALFIKSFIAGAYRIPNGAEPGVAKGIHWFASHLDTGFSAGDLIIFENENGQPWIARVVAREDKGLRLKRGGSPDEFSMPWDKIIGKMLFSHFSPDALKLP
ncbi:MAG: protein kinase [Verrucomicrobiales bacterium]|nr:protein kinase [Verrucomicrobiales bacterium]